MQTGSARGSCVLATGIEGTAVFREGDFIEYLVKLALEESLQAPQDESPSGRREHKEA